MPIASGARLGQYEVLTPLGAGGMGEVYRARDTRLRREVAIKVLPAALAQKADYVARFEREARALAALNHAGIAAIYGLEEGNGFRFLAMELVEGETLAERLGAGGPLPVEEALRIAHGIAEALEAAHAKGIVHRDLKPANIKLTPEGKVKVLDFGLAKMMEEEDPGLSRADTLRAAETREGTILGTPFYMSPEQARGRAVDRRADLWALGCVLYEMLTGRRAFDSETAPDALAAILTAEPDWKRLPRQTPDDIRKLLLRCLEKDPARRQRDAGDAAVELESALKSLSSLPTPRDEAGGRPSLLETLSAFFRPARAPADSPAPFIPPRLSQVTFSEQIEQFPAWSPDGERLAFCRETENGKRRIIARNLDGSEERALTDGETDDIQPDWAPDGRSIVFARGRNPGRKVEPNDVFGAYEGTDLCSLELATGRAVRLAENAANPAFSPDGSRIAFDASWAGPRRIWIANERGRNPQQSTSDDSEAVVHVRPRWSPDGNRIVFQNIERTKLDVRVVDLASKRLSWITNDHVQDLAPAWSSTGFVYFSSYRGGGVNIWRVAVSPAGEPAGLLQQLTTGAGQDVEPAITRDGRRLAFTILRQNADIWRLPVSPESGRPAGAPEKLIATTREDSRGAWSADGKWIAFNSDRSGDMNIWLHSMEDGSSRPLTTGPGGDFQPNFSPDGGRVAFFSSRAGNVDVWVVETRGGRPRRLTRGPGISVNPAFSPDGERIAYLSDDEGRLEVCVMDAGGGGARRLTDTGVLGHFLQWTADGRFVVFRSPSGVPRTMRVPSGGGEPEEMAEVAGGAHMSFSPDQSRIMDVVGHRTLWVSPLSGGKPEKVFEFEDADSRIDYPRWSPDGRWVLFDRFRPSGGDVWTMQFE